MISVLCIIESDRILGFKGDINNHIDKKNRKRHLKNCAAQPNNEMREMSYQRYVSLGNEGVQ